MNRKPRAFLVDEDDRLRSIPYARFERINGRRQGIHLFAGKCIRSILVIVETDENGVRTMIYADFVKWEFDESGLLNTEHKRASLHDGVNLLSQERDWQELHGMEYAERFCWKPTEELLSRLHRMIRDNTKRG